MIDKTSAFARVSVTTKFVVCVAMPPVNATDNVIVAAFCTVMSLAISDVADTGSLNVKINLFRDRSNVYDTSTGGVMSGK